MPERMRTQVRGSEVTNTNKKETIDIQESGRLSNDRFLFLLMMKNRASHLKIKAIIGGKT